MSQTSGASETDVEQGGNNSPKSSQDSTTQTSQHAARHSPRSPLKPDKFVKNGEDYKVHKNYSCFLQRVDADENMNKFYVLQLLKNTKTDIFNLFFRWGKVEHQGRYRIGKDIDNVQDAESAFESKFLEKTGVLWKERFQFEGDRARYRLIDDDRLRKRIESGARAVSRRTSVDSNAEVDRANHMKPVAPRRSQPKPKEESEQQPPEEQKEEAREEPQEDIKPFQAPQKEKDKIKEEPHLNLLRAICFEINVLKDTDFATKKGLDKMSEELYNKFPKLFPDMKGKPISDNNKLKEASKRIFEHLHKQGKSLTDTEP